MKLGLSVTTLSSGLLLFVLHVDLRCGSVHAFYTHCRCERFARRSSVSNNERQSNQEKSREDTKTDSSKRSTEGPRPLTQNWWPVTMAAALDPSRPNPIELLDKKLVLWRDSSSSWSCLEDQCAHRCAPLSEGRVVPWKDYESGDKKCLQCAYHGWEFNGVGSCTRIPQLQTSKKKQNAITKPIKNYPVREEAGMIWVWADPLHRELAQSVALPISSLLRRFEQAGMAANGFMRDLPYGYELLGENLVDISHLPFSHHSVGGLNRIDGRPVPLKMLSRSESLQASKSQNGHGAVLPLFQAQVINATEHDPEIVAMLKNPEAKTKSDPSLALATVGFFDPCHVRYHRNPGIQGSSYEINLFLCPTSAGKSRVFLFTPFEAMLNSIKPANSSSPRTMEEKPMEQGFSAAERNKKKLQPFFSVFRAAREFFKPKPAGFAPHMGHMIAHRIFDGDGIFLHKQGDRMRRSKLTYHDYHTPTSSDAIVNAYRRWLDRAASVTKSVGEESAAVASTGGGSYHDDLARSEMLDRYTSHTAHCKICLVALKQLEDKRDETRMISTALLGASGASSVLTISPAIFLVFSRLVARSSQATVTATRAGISVMLSCFLTAIGCFFAARMARKKVAVLENDIKPFYFEDYIHAEKH